MTKLVSNTRVTQKLMLEFDVDHTAYTGTNAINSFFGVPDLDLMYEIVEIGFRVESPVLRANRK